jgi:2-methylcitrate dehydratase PrpD
MSSAVAFARFAAALQWRALPDAVRGQATDHALDMLAVACAGATEPESRLLRDAHAHFAGDGACTVVADARRLPPVDAALVNAFAARIHTFDDTLEAGPIHPGSSILCAAFAAAEFRGATLAEALAGAIAGLECAVRLVEALGPGHYDAGFHGTGTLNAPAAALAASRALGLDADRSLHALNLAAAAATGTRQYQIDGGMPHSAMNGARAAAAGVLAALQAEAGVTAPAGQLDGRWGLLALLRGEGRDTPPATGTLGSDWAIRRVALKPYATCRFTHGPIAVLDALRQAHGLRAEDIAEVEIATFAQSASVSDRPRWHGRREAILSHHFAAAATLLHGPPRLAQLDALAADPAVRALADRVRVTVDDAYATRAAASWPHRLRVTLRDGSVLAGFSPSPPGGEDQPLEASVLRAKALGLVEDALGTGRFAPLPPLLAAPERTHVADLLRALRPAAIARDAA